MKAKANLMAALVGLAMLATPIAASAKDKNHYFIDSHQGRPYAVVVNKHDFRKGAKAAWIAAPRRIAPVEWRDHRWNDHDADDYRGYRNYYPAPVYNAPVYAPAYPAYGGYGTNCRTARNVIYNYRKDRATGHPAAAYDLLRQNQWAFHSGCAAGTPYAGGRFGGYGGAPAYGYGQPYNGGSILTPFLGQFVR